MLLLGCLKETVHTSCKGPDKAKLFSSYMALSYAKTPKAPPKPPSYLEAEEKEENGSFPVGIHKIPLDKGPISITHSPFQLSSDTCIEHIDYWMKSCIFVSTSKLFVLPFYPSNSPRYKSGMHSQEVKSATHPAHTGTPKVLSNTSGVSKMIKYTFKVAKTQVT